MEIARRAFVKIGYHDTLNEYFVMISEEYIVVHHNAASPAQSALAPPGQNYHQLFVLTRTAWTANETGLEDTVPRYLVVRARKPWAVSGMTTTPA